MSQNQDIFDFDVNVFEQQQQLNQLTPIKSQIEQPLIPLRRQEQSEPIISVQRQKPKKVVNRFSLTDQQKINISKRLPRGFILLKRGDFPQYKSPFHGQIQYIPLKRQTKIASQQLLQKLPLSILAAVNPRKQVQRKIQKPGLRLSSGQFPQGKSKQTQKVKGVLQKFRKHQKYPILASQLNKFGLMQGFTQIQAQIKKNIHTIDSFKDRCLYILNQVKLTTYAQITIQAINQLIDEFMFQIQQAKKLQFENNLIMIQKNIDKITREITDIRQSGNWYLRKKKRTQKNFQEKEVMYIADLVRELPPAYLVGVWEIIEEKPFLQSQQKQMQINFSQLKTKKIRQIESYVKRKHNTYLNSRERKREKLQRKLAEQEGRVYGKSEKVEGKMGTGNQQGKVKQRKGQELEGIGVQQQLQNFLSIQDLEGKQKRQIETLPKKHQDEFLQLDQLLLTENNNTMRHIDDNYLSPHQEGQETRNDKQVQNSKRRQGDLDELQSELKQKVEEEERQDKEFEMQEPDLRMPQPLQGDSSDSSFITDDEDSDY